jgi:hypothetical protein
VLESVGAAGVPVVGWWASQVSSSNTLSSFSELPPAVGCQLALDSSESSCQGVRSNISDPLVRQLLHHDGAAGLLIGFASSVVAAQ